MAIKKIIDNKITNANLSKTEAKVAEYISKNYLQVCFTPVIKLAHEIGTSDTSVIRTARKLGYEGYSDLQDAIMEEIKDDIEHNGGVNYMPPASRLEKKQSLIQSDNLYLNIAEKMIENLSNIITSNGEISFERASDIILNSKRKFIMGFRGCTSVAQIIGSSLGDIFSDVRTVIDADSRALENIIDISDNDCLVIISYPRYNHMALTVAEIAKEKNAKIIAFTDKITSPIAKGADVVIKTSVDGVTVNDSYVAPVAAAEMLLAAVYKKGIGPKERSNMELLEKYIHEKGLF